MDRKELNKIKKAIKSMRSEDNSLYIEGENFSCRWNGKSFTWTINGRTYKNCTVKDIISWIADGRYIKYYSYDYTI